MSEPLDLESIRAYTHAMGRGGDWADLLLLAEVERLRAELARRDEQIAAAWDEGQASGWSRAMRYMTDEPHLPRAVNPYRGAS